MALVISIIVLLILATVSINLVINNGIIDKAKTAADKYSDGEIEEKIKLAYLEWQTAKITGTTENANDFIKNILNSSIGNVEDVSLEDNALTVTINKYNEENTYYYNIKSGVTKQIVLAKNSSNKNDSYVGCYADIDEDGIVDGIIFADLLTGSIRDSQNYAGYTYTLPQNVTTNNVKKYYIIQDNYTDSHFETHPVISPIGSNSERRFFVMSLNDFASLAYTDIEDETKNYPSFNSFTWYNKGTGIDKNETSWNVGTGKTNTDTILDKWNNNIYGEHDNQDIWKHIRTKYNEDWFLPSGAEWTAFIVELRNYKRKLLLKIWTSKKLLVFYFI